MNRRRAALGGAAVGLLLLTGCGHQERLENQERSAENGRQIEERLPDIIRAAGWDSVHSVRETSCVGVKTDPDDAAEKTQWTAGRTVLDATPSEAQRVAEGVQHHAEQTGWTIQPRGEHLEDLLVRATHGDLYLRVEYDAEGGRQALGVHLSTPCREMPPDHAMTRSGLDHQYGSPDPWYPGEDRSSFRERDGKPKPLPTPSG